MLSTYFLLVGGGKYLEENIIMTPLVDTIYKENNVTFVGNNPRTCTYKQKLV